MKISQRMRHIPILYTLMRGLRDRFRTKRVLQELDKVSNPRGIQLRDALLLFRQGLSQIQKKEILIIENERTNQFNRTEMLVDGSLGKGGIYDEGITVQEACRVSKPPEPARLLFLLTLSMKPKNIIELGTNVGISSAYLGSALKIAGQNGKLTTLDVSPYRQKIARDIHRNLGLHNITYVEGVFKETLRNTLQRIDPVDLAFIDGHHQYQPTLDYFNEIYQYSTTDAIFIFDDIRWSEGMIKAWSKIQSDKRLGLIIDLGGIGICARANTEISERYVSPPLKVY